MSQLVVQSFMGYFICVFEKCSEAVQDYSSLLCFPEAGPLFIYCFLVWFCVHCYVLRTVKKGYNEKLVQEVVSSLMETVSWQER